jgi:trimethylamine--corrinoid protein Co-methyltransferase
MVDWETGKRRYSTSEDIAQCARIADYLDHVDLIWPLGAGNDVPAPMRYIVDMCTSLRNCEKHFEGDATTGKEAQYQIEIAAAIVGGREELRERPIFSHVICTLSPLCYDKGMTEASIELGRAGIPVVIYPMPTTGGTGPATLAGTMVVNNAEFLGGLVIQEFASPGAPVVYAASVDTIDFKTGANMPSPENSLMHLGLNQVAHYYDLPSEISVTGGTTAKVLDTQAGYEQAITILTQISTTPDIALGMGGLEGARMTSAEALVIDNEIIDYALRFVEGFEVNDDTLAVDIIDKVGPGGIYLGEKHTVQHFRERWMSRLSDISSYETWEKQGSRSIDEVAREKVREILATHKVAPLPEDVDKEIGRILKRAEAELL